MPELPEVEGIVTALRKGGHGATSIVGRRIVDAHVASLLTVAEPRAFEKAVLGRTIVDVQRRAKLLLVSLDPRGRARGAAKLGKNTNESSAKAAVTTSSTVTVHLRMTGELLHLPYAPLLKQRRVTLTLEDEGGARTALVLDDPRHLARMALLDDVSAVLAAYGPEPLDDEFTAAVLGKQLRSRKTIVKAALLDQSVLAGIGNIYADESLFEARISPLRPTLGLDAGEVKRLHKALKSVLRRAVKGRIQGIDWMHKGGAGAEFVVYRKTGEPCPRCGTPIKRLVVSGRGTHVCMRCQSIE